MAAPHIKVQVSLLGQAKCCHTKLIAGTIWMFPWLNTLKVNFLVSIGMTSGVWRADFRVDIQGLRFLPSCATSMFSLCAPWNGMRMGHIPWSWPGSDTQHSVDQDLIIWPHPSCSGGSEERGLLAWHKFFVISLLFLPRCVLVSKCCYVG